MSDRRQYRRRRNIKSCPCGQEYDAERYSTPWADPLHDILQCVESYIERHPEVEYE